MTSKEFQLRIKGLGHANSKGKKKKFIKGQYRLLCAPLWFNWRPDTQALTLIFSLLCSNSNHVWRYLQKSITKSQSLLGFFLAESPGKKYSLDFLLIRSERFGSKRRHKSDKIELVRMLHLVQRKLTRIASSFTRKAIFNLHSNDNQILIEHYKFAHKNTANHVTVITLFRLGETKTL